MNRPGTETGSSRSHNSEKPTDPRHGLVFGAFAKLRKATVSFFMFACLSVRMEQLGSHWTDFDEILYEFFENLSRIFKFR